MNLACLNALLFFFLLGTAWCQPVLSSMDFTTNVMTLQYPYSNSVGLSLYLPEVIPYVNDPIFLSRINMSRFDGHYANMFSYYLHVPKGYKYNCNTTLYGGNITCIQDLSTDPSLTTALNNLFYDYSNYYSVDLGYDIERANFSKAAYMNNFKKYMNIFSNDGINLELIDYGDSLSSIYNITYTVNNFISDVSTITYSYYGLYVDGPGISENANSSWVNKIHTLFNNFGTTFTFRCIVFKNSSDATIANLMSETYSSVYLQNRLVDASNTTINMGKYAVAINDIRLTNDSGVDGVTDSFAAALWALDISMAFSSMSGYSINFYSPLNDTNQSVIGAAPYFQSGAIYYGLLFALYSLRDYPMMTTVTVASGISQSIKVYGMDSYVAYRVLIINKDLNPNASGVINLKHPSTVGLRCYYLSAPSLDSTQNITFAGMYFVGNSSDYAGEFYFLDYQMNPLQIYAIELNYSQAALCEDLPSSPSSWTELLRGRSSQLGEGAIMVGVGLLLVILAL